MSGVFVCVLCAYMHVWSVWKCLDVLRSTRQTNEELYNDVNKFTNKIRMRHLQPVGHCYLETEDPASTFICGSKNTGKHTKAHARLTCENLPLMSE